MGSKILIIEDEIKTAVSLKRGLEEYGFKSEITTSGNEGLKMVVSQNDFNLIVSDIILPDMNGIQVCQNLREKGFNTPVLLLTALGTIDDKVNGFEAGADDYLVKPFEFKELLYRVRSLLKRTNFTAGKNTVLSFSDLILDLNAKTVFRGEKDIPLTSREFALMEYFLRNPNRVISKSEIAEKVWSIHFDTGTNVIEVYVNYLRNKIDKKFKNKLIHTAHGMGYILKEI